MVCFLNSEILTGLLNFISLSDIVNMPSTSYKDKDGNTQYNDTFHAITKSAREAINQAVLNAYDIKLQQVQSTEIDVQASEDEESEETSEDEEPIMTI